MTISYNFMDVLTYLESLNSNLALIIIIRKYYNSNFHFFACKMQNRNRSIFQLFLFLYCCLQNANKEPWICQIWATNLYRSVCHSYNDTLRAKSCTWAGLQEICCFFICIFVKLCVRHVLSVFCTL